MPAKMNIIPAMWEKYFFREKVVNPKKMGKMALLRSDRAGTYC